MLINGKTVGNGDTLSTDVCIVGAGAAGLSLAQALDGAPFSVLLLESGGFCPEADIQSLAAGTSEHQPYPFMESRARRLGGSTTRWSGICIPLDKGDFEARPWLPYSGWPLTREALWPYYQRAQRLFGLPEQMPDLPTDFPLGQAPLETKIVRVSHPLDLGARFKRQIVQSRNVTLLTYANVAHLIPDADGRRVVQLSIKNPSGPGFWVKPKTIILATGGIENARLLLASNHDFPRGLGNSHDLVGRFFMEHNFQVVGILPLGCRQKDALFFTNFTSLRGSPRQGTLGFTDEFRLQHQLLNLHLRFFRYSLLEDTPEVIAAKRLQTAASPKRDLKAAAAHWRQMWGDFGKTPLRYAGWHFWNQASRFAPFHHVRLQAWVEQEPDPENRVTLSRQRDCLGEPRAHLNLRFSRYMNDSVERSLQLIGPVLNQRGFGLLQHDRDRFYHLTPYNKIGLHHMGTTRMNSDPKQGVVNANCKIHDLANVYISGSSVFPTGGAANPTFTIAALALRLADHIRTLY